MAAVTGPTYRQWLAGRGSTKTLAQEWDKRFNAGRRFNPAPALSPTPPAATTYQQPQWLQDIVSDFDTRAQAHQTWAQQQVAPYFTQQLQALNNAGQTAQAHFAALANQQAQGFGALGAQGLPQFSGSQGAITAPLGATQQAAQAGALSQGQALASDATYRGAAAALSQNADIQGLVAGLGAQIANIPNRYAEQREAFMRQLAPIQMQLEGNREERIASQEFQNKRDLEDRRRWAIEFKENRRVNDRNYQLDAMNSQLEQLLGGLEDVKPVQRGDDYTRDWFIEKGWKQVPANAGPKWKAAAVEGHDGSGLWIPPGKGGGSGSGSGGSAKVGPGSVNYANMVENWTKQAAKLYAGKRESVKDQLGKVIGTQIQQGSRVGPLRIYQQASAAGLRPGDAFKVTAAALPNQDAVDDFVVALYNEIEGTGVSEAEARRQTVKITGLDPLVLSQLGGRGGAGL